MPRIGKTFIKTGNLNVEVIIYYIDDTRARFAVTPVLAEYANDPTGTLKSITIAKGRHYPGIAGNTEEEVLKAFKEYLIKWQEVSLKKIPVILIQTPGSDGQNHFHKPNEDNKRWNNTVRQTGCKVVFEYFFCYKMLIGGEYKYFKDGVYKSTDKDEKIYDNDIKSYTLIPGTPENLAKCEDIINQMNALNDKLTELFKDTDTAQQTLNSSSIKLLNQ